MWLSCLGGLNFTTVAKNKGGFYAHALNCKPTSLSESEKKGKHKKGTYELKFKGKNPDPENILLE